MDVPFVDLAPELARSRPAIDAAIARVLDSGHFIGGPEVVGFERELAAATGSRRAIGVSSGTDALLVTLMALGVGPGDDVVTTPFTFVATASAAARLGARVVFADIDPLTLTLDPTAATTACSTATRAVIPVPLFGHPGTAPVVPCALVVDAAQALGGAPAAGLASTISFFPTKNLGALGDAGAVLTDDDALADAITALRTHGARGKCHHVFLGGNFRLDALQAAILRVRLPRLAAITAERRAVAALYRSAFAARSLPAELQLPAEHPAHTYHQLVIRTPRRDALRTHLAARGVGTEVYYLEPLHLQPCFSSLGYRAGSLPEAERAAQDVLALPIRPGIESHVVEYVVDAIAAFFAR